MTLVSETRPSTSEDLRFLWLELTAQCNLSCVHCYSESGPNAHTPGALTTDEYVSIIDSAAELGCRQVQFIGGEPTLFRDLTVLIDHAHAAGYTFIEVFTNAVHVSEQLLACLVRNKVNVATSFYSDQPDVHDAITQGEGSHAKTVRTLRRLVDSGLEVRAGIIVMEHNQARVAETEAFLRDLGITNIGIDGARGVGRGIEVTQHEVCDPMAELCGNCWMGRLCISPEGTVWPCIMSRAWPVGSVRENTLGEIMSSTALSEVQDRIYTTAYLPKAGAKPEDGDCEPDPCSPRSCSPCQPNYCNPCSPQCGPNCSPGCEPTTWVR
jgi:uncharacterized Fe-S cluster-containing radical SAM superfamily protein